MFFESVWLNVSILIALIIALLIDYITKFHSYWYVRNVRFMRSMPIFGNDYAKLFMQISVSDFIKKCYVVNSNDKFFGRFRGRIPDLIIRDPDTISAVLNHDFNHFSKRGLTWNKGHEPLLSNLHHSDGEKWMILRELMNTSLSSDNLVAMLPLLFDCVEEYQRYLAHIVKSDTNFDLSELIPMFVTNAIRQCVFGVNVDDSKDQKTTFCEVTRSFDTKSISYNIKLYLDSVLPGLTKYMWWRTTDEKTRKYYDELVLRKINEVEASNGCPFVKKIAHVKELFIDTNKPIALSDDTRVVTAQCFSFISEGLIPCSNVIIFALNEIAHDSEVHNKLNHEITAVMANHKTISIECLKSMIYLQKVVLETLRLHPIQCYINRQCQIPYKIPNTDIVLDKGITVTIPVEGLHRDATYFANPEKFDPERFSAAEQAKRHSSCYLPFGEGPRACIGSKFAEHIIKAGIVSVLQNYTVEPCSESSSILPCRVLSDFKTPSSGVWLKITPKQQ